MPYVSNKGVRIHYEVEGEGPPLVLQHGSAGSLEDWHEFGYVEALKRQGNRTWTCLAICLNSLPDAELIDSTEADEYCAGGDCDGPVCWMLGRAWKTRARAVPGCMTSMNC